MISSNQFKIFNLALLALTVFLPNERVVIAHSANKQAKSNQNNQTIKGQSGGSIDSQGCGFIASSPNYEMNLDKRLDYMRLTVMSAGGQPTLLVLGPNSGDSFCVLGDEISGLKPEISGVWESGNYQIFIGDRLGGRHQFTLDISTDN